MTVKVQVLVPPMPTAVPVKVVVLKTCIATLPEVASGPTPLSMLNDVASVVDQANVIVLPCKMFTAVGPLYTMPGGSVTLVNVQVGAGTTVTVAAQVPVPFPVAVPVYVLVAVSGPTTTLPLNGSLPRP